MQQSISQRVWIGLVRCLAAGIFIACLQQARAGWQLVWGDDFAGSAISATNWTFDNGNGNGGWGNRELEYYTSRPENVYVTNGMLHIVARKEIYQGHTYTSAKLKTHGLFSQKYGRFEFCARLPQGKGYWPALWMMPEKAVYGRWAASGEIDVMENKGTDPAKIFGTIHFGGVSPFNAQSHGPSFKFPTSDSVTNFHLYAVEWSPNAISWYVDNHVYETQTNWWSSRNSTDPGARNPYPAPFDQPFYIIMNLAVGGNFGGNPDDTTVFPGEMQVKYVHVYQKASVASPSIISQSENASNEFARSGTSSISTGSATAAPQTLNNSATAQMLR